MASKKQECVKVMVRCRPMNKSELQKNCQQVVQVDKSISQIILQKPDDQPRQFTFDLVYGSGSKQQEVYDECGFSLVESVLSGYNGTIFAYGQTGCGKTHTMMGPTSSLDENGDISERGIIPNAIRHIFGCIDSSDKNRKFLVRCSYLEIYNE